MIPSSDRELLETPAGELAARAGAAARAAYGNRLTYSPKVFIPLTRLCRDFCGYCTFSRDHERGRSPYLSIDEVLAIAAAGAARACSEALFTLGDKPELRYPRAAAWLAAQGYASTAHYLAEACRAVVRETGLLPHVNAGVLGREELAALREVSVSQGLMLEACAERLLQKGQPHYRSPDKHPALRLQMLREAGELAIPMTTGLLIGIGETRQERLETLREIRRLHEAHGHIQEVIVQNFCPKPGTPMQGAPAATLDEQLWTIAAARLILPAGVSLQSPPNLRPGEAGRLAAAGINDLGGISPVTADHVNPEAPWPQIDALRAGLAREGLALAPRLPVYPAYAQDRGRWIAPALHRPLLAHADAAWLARDDRWTAGSADGAPPRLPGAVIVAADAVVGADTAAGNAAAANAATIDAAAVSAAVAGRADDGALRTILDDAEAGRLPDARGIEALFAARGDDVAAVLAAADRMRRRIAGDTVTYVVNRNINYTNICSYRCGFCAFSKRTGGARPSEGPYDLDLAEVAARAREAWQRGATEVCMQGGIHPAYDGNTYLALLRAVKEAVPALHVHAFSPLEVQHGASTLGVSTGEFLQELKRQGLGSLPGTAAEILCDDVRRVICPDKLTASQWLDVVRAAHRAGLRTTSTIMFGHVESPAHWARHLVALRDLQADTGGITEFVPLPFVPFNSPIYKRGQARRGPTWRETLLMYAVSRLAFGTLIPNIQTSWVKLGPRAAQLTLRAGVNDFGGVLMNESISRAAGAEWGQGVTAEQIRGLATEIGRCAQQRTTLYRPVDPAPHGRFPIPVVMENCS
ncbi:bifunctional FO biosynthesis protein CofGH [Pigmentiphaga soli]|uniref:FO synthase n=1 Tax=Pigmentiphaga soli TaxID=1007095 RepID=A0ABP8GES5_9BURK